MMEYLSRFIENYKLDVAKHKILVAVSGGIDSIVMLDLLIQRGFKCVIAHCNFGLRGQESDEDEQFVRFLGKKYNTEVVVKLFSTIEYSSLHGISIQMAARELRYNWFEELRLQYQLDFIAVAHSKNDAIETFLFNIIRGTGIQGLTGIKEVNRYIIRPILGASRSEIEEYAKQHGLLFREDSSNSQIKYSRNKIRHQIIPLLKEINPDIENTITREISVFSDIAKIFYEKVEEKKATIINCNKDRVYISIHKLRQCNPSGTYLFEFIKEFGFTYSQCIDIIESLTANSGKQFLSSTHTLIKDRDSLIVIPINKNEINISYSLPDNGSINLNGLSLSVQTKMNSAGFIIDTSPEIAMLDKEKLQFPLIIRKWKPGDSFVPLGMKQHKKLSDFFIDRKISLADKHTIWLLFSGNDIVWIIGYCIDGRFKVTSQTKEISVIKLNIEDIV